MKTFWIAVGVFFVITDGYSIRSATVTDVPIVADLLTSVFENHLPWWEFPERSARRNRYELHVRDRIIRGSRESHMAAVAISSEGSIVGFVEAGLLPAPPGFIDHSTILNPLENGYSFDRSDDRNCAQTTSSNDVPYIANLCVAGKCLRQGLGRRLVDVASIWATDQGAKNVFVGVDADNTIARRLYESMKFELVEFPDNYSIRRRVYYFRPLTVVDTS